MDARYQSPEAGQCVSNRSITNQAELTNLSLARTDFASAIRRAPAATPQSITDKPEGMKYIYSQPAGDCKEYVQDGMCFYATAMQVYQQSTNGCVSRIVTSDDNKAYIYNMIPLTGYPGWVEGSIADGYATFEYPQIVSMIQYDTPEGIVTQNIYAVLCEYTKTADGRATYIPCENQTWKLKIGADGSYTNENPDILVAECIWVDATESEAGHYGWVGGGNLVTSMKPLTATTVEVPADIQFEDWWKIADGNAEKVQVGTDGKDLYIKGIYSTLPETAIKGTINGSTVTFPKLQYIGIEPALQYTAYFTGAKAFSFGGSTTYLMQDFSMEYNPNAKTLTSTGMYIINSNPDKVLPIDYASNPVIKYQSPDVAITSVPAPYDLVFWPVEDDYEAEIDFNYSLINKDGVILDSSKLFYNLLVDGEVFTFYDDEYLDVDGEMTDVPVSYVTNYNFYGEGTLRAIVLYIDGFESLGIQMIYKDGDKEIRSEITTLDVDGIHDITLDATATSEKFFDLNGREVKSPKGGLFIRRATYSDGSVVNSKVIR